MMALAIAVQTRLLLAVVLLAAGTLRAAEAPDAKEILRIVRVAHAAQNRSLDGRLRTRNKTVPFKLSMADKTVRWEFSDPPQTLVLRLGDKDARLEETGPDGTQKVGAARFDDKVRDSDITYEDLSLRFLYWPNAAVEGEQTMVLQKCWIVRVEPPAKNDSQYGKVKLWIAQESGALMQAEAYDHSGNFARRFKVISGQKTDDGLWILKQMRIESAGPTARGDTSPTYLEIEKAK
jgi:hypothetical protein